MDIMTAEGLIACVYESASEVVCNGTKFHHEEAVTPGGNPGLFWTYVGVSLGLVTTAGLMSGLTMGLMSLDIMTLRILKNEGEPKERKYAARILPLVKRHHLLLVTLLLANAAAMEALPLFLDKLMPPYAAIIVSVTGVLFVGEIIPQAVCTRYGLAIGAKLSYFVYGLMFLLLPISWPISKLMDLILGIEHGTFFRRAELSELIKIHGTDIVEDNEEPLIEDEVKIIRGALLMAGKKVEECMTPIDKVFSLAHDSKLDATTMRKITESGFSRIPIYDKDLHDLSTALLVKSHIMLDPDDAVPVHKCLEQQKQVHLKKFPWDLPLYDALNEFQQGHRVGHMAVVVGQQGQTLGIITLEDLIEELLLEEIIDETDVYEDVTARKRVTRLVKKLSNCNTVKLRLTDLVEERAKIKGGDDVVYSDVADNTPLLVNR